MPWNGPGNPGVVQWDAGAIFIAPASDLPVLPGSYGLRLALSESIDIPIGRLGTFCFPAGLYFYCGSARGPGGLRARLAHHAHLAARPHWHLDALRAYAEIEGGWFLVEETPAGPIPLECQWSQELAGLPGTIIPALGFGASDCRCGCRAHLIGFSARI